MGFKVRLRLVTQDAMYTRFCNSPPANVAICPNVSWGKDFADAQTMLDPTFNGKNIVQQGNSNWPELNDPKINAAMDKAELLTDPKERADAWGEDRRDGHRGRPARRLDLGQAGAAALRRRQRRGERVQLDVGPVVDLTEVT